MLLAQINLHRNSLLLWFVERELRQFLQKVSHLTRCLALQRSLKEFEEDSEVMRHGMFFNWHLCEEYVDEVRAHSLGTS